MSVVLCAARLRLNRQFATVGHMKHNPKTFTTVGEGITRFTALKASKHTPEITQTTFCSSKTTTTLEVNILTFINRGAVSQPALKRPSKHANT